MSNETMFNNELKEGVKRKMLNYDINKTNKELKDNNIPIINNTYNYYKECYNTTNSNNKYGDYNNKLDLNNCKIPFNEMDNNSNSLFNNKKQISEDDIKNSKVYKELEEKYNNKVKEYNTLKENKENEIQILKDKINKIYKNIKLLLFNFRENKDKEFSNILMTILDVLFLDNDNKGGE